ncbi:MAG: Bacterial Ig-like domain [Chloroflexota bacterium]|jgi:hypothetical protein|nr:Bacterial Ig-like domain [Chloroflexota bacterium]
MFGASAASIALAACVASAPAIQEVSPFKGQGDVAGDAPVTVGFDRAMDEASVDSRLELRPAIDGCDTVVCPITWKGNTMSLSHSEHPFAGDTKYRVVIHAGYSDSAGSVNNVEHVWEFHTEPAPALRASTPSSGATGVATDADLTLQFSRGLLPPAPGLVTLRAGEGAGADVPYHLGLGGQDQSQVTIAPLQPLRPNTSYRLSVSENLADIHHNRLGRRSDIDFITGDLDLTRSLGFAVLDNQGRPTRLASLRPPTSLGAPPPTMRVLYTAADAITAWGWSSDARFLYVLQGDPAALVRVDLASGVASPIPVTAISMAPSPGRDEVAYVGPGGDLHLWSTGGDIAVPQAGKVLAPPNWSDDGRRLGLVTEGVAGARLAIIDRGTLSRYLVPGAEVELPGAMRWSHDGGNLAFVGAPRAAGIPEVWIYRALAAEGPVLQDVAPLPATSLAWSSDELTLFASTAMNDPEGGVLQHAPARPAPGQDASFAPVRGSQPRDSSPIAPSFDRRLAFLRPSGSEPPQLWLINNDGTGLLQLTSDSYDVDSRLAARGVSMPAWAPGSAVRG